MTSLVELIDLIPNSMSFRIVATLDLAEGAELPAGFTGRVRRHLEGRLRSSAWYQNGRLHNPGRQHAAFRAFRESGRLKYELWCTDGELQDPSATAAAVRGWYADGTPHYEERWTRGRRQDGSDGTPAIRKWRADGSLRHERRYAAGARIG